MSQREFRSGGCLNRRQLLALGASVPVLAGTSLIHVSAQEPERLLVSPTQGRNGVFQGHILGESWKSAIRR